MSGLHAMSEDSHSHPLHDEPKLVAGWKVALVTGALNLVAGLVVLLEPHTSLLAVALVVGIYLVIAGIAAIGFGATREPIRWLVMGLGLLALIAGVLVIIRPGSAIRGVLLVFGIYLVLAGCVRIIGGAAMSDGRVGELLRGVLDLAAGVVFLVAPKLGLTALALFVGLYLLARAVVELALAWSLHSLSRSAR